MAKQPSKPTSQTRRKPASRAAKSTSQEKTARKQGSMLEWIVAAFGLAIVLGTVGFLVYVGLTQPDTPPNIEVASRSIAQTPNGFLVTFEATNNGNATAQAVTITGVLRTGSETIEESEANIDYLPEHSSVEGGLFFTLDPSQYALELRALGYALP